MKKGLLLLGIAMISLSFMPSEKQFSDPHAPVGDKSLTVPACVKPILDYWMRDPYIMLGPDDYYYMVGTTATPDRYFPGQKHCWDYNDGYYMWRSKDMKTWESRGLIWSYDKDATWQKLNCPKVPEGKTSINGDPQDSIYRAAWAPEIHYIKSKKQWLLIGCQNGKAGSFILKSTSGKPEGPYVNIEGNKNGHIFKNIDLSVFEDDNGDVYAVAHNHYIAKMKDDLSDIAEPWRTLKETPYNPEPYIEGVYIVKHDGKYQLLQTVWSTIQEDGSYKYTRVNRKRKHSYSYDVVVAVADNIYGPYGPRYPAILEGGHNNIFKDKDGAWWSTTFFNPGGIMGQKFPVTCRPAVVAVEWVDGKLRPDMKRNKAFYSTID